jgi:zinc finger protein
MAKPNVLKGQQCPMCGNNTLTLMEEETEVPYFGKMYLFGMQCSSCKYNKSDVENIEDQDPVKLTVEISGEEDMKIRVVKSSQATVKIPHLMTIEPGPGSNGYITNIEGILNRVKNMLESVKESEDDKSAQKKAKNQIKKINRTIHGSEKLKIIIEDPSGNSAIISDKVKKEKLKKK